MPSSRDLERQLALAQAKIGEQSEKGSGWNPIFLGSYGHKYSQFDFDVAEASAIAEARRLGASCGPIFAVLDTPRPGSLPVKSRKRKPKTD